MKIARDGRNELLPLTVVGPHFYRYGIVGQSRAIGDVIRRIELVSASCSTVLITGETGTGKELVARAVHQRSDRQNMPLIKVNCAAIPETLLESELFGHVRGAFTDAAATKKGKFSLANRGSIFLDEIGTMSAGLQAKLLRVLQEREFEPLGAEHTEHVDVRVIAATNRDLRHLVDEGRFQDDLFYRLHVVPIVVPPLRERVEDIPMLVQYFVSKHAARNGKPIDTLEDGVIASLQDYHWPGNVRELENTIERAVVLTTGHVIARDVVTMETSTPSVHTPSSLSLKLHQNVEWVERETIRRALELSTVKRQAARLLGISPRALAYYLAKYPLIDKKEHSMARTPFPVSAIALLVAALTLTASLGASAGQAPAVQADPHAAHSGANSSALVEKVREATEAFRHVIPDGYQQFLGCVSGPEAGAMGVHFVNFSLVDTEIDPEHPEALIYEFKNGRARLVGVEFIVPAQPWDTTHLGPPPVPPVLEGQVFHFNESPNRFRLDPFYELHVWAWRDNPNGIYADWNTRVSCDGQ